jgi:hypothetical protein
MSLRFKDHVERHWYNSDWLSVFEKETKQVHVPGRHFFQTPAQCRSFGARFISFGSLLASVVSIELSFITDAGGHSIAPYLPCSRVVSCSSPAYDLILNGIDFYVYDDDSKRCLHKCPDDLVIQNAHLSHTAGPGISEYQVLSPVMGLGDLTLV